MSGNDSLLTKDKYQNFFSKTSSPVDVKNNRRELVSNAPVKNSRELQNIPQDKFEYKNNAKDKIKPVEAAYLFGKGFVKRALGVAGIVAFNALLIMGLGLAGGAALIAKKRTALGALGIGAIATSGISLLLGAKNIKNCKQNINNGNKDKAKKNIVSSGKNAFLLAATAPFVPKLYKPAGQLAKKILLKR